MLRTENQLNKFISRLSLSLKIYEIKTKVYLQNIRKLDIRVTVYYIV